MVKRFCFDSSSYGMGVGVKSNPRTDMRIRLSAWKDSPGCSFLNRLEERQGECGEPMDISKGSWDKDKGLRWALQAARPTHRCLASLCGPQDSGQC